MKQMEGDIRNFLRDGLSPSRIMIVHVRMDNYRWAETVISRLYSHIKPPSVGSWH